VELDRYVADLRAHLAAAADAGDAEARALAERLSLALDAAVRLVLLEVLSDAASEITREIAPGSVDVRLRGRDPALVVSRPMAATFADIASVPADPAETVESAPAEPQDDTVSSRTTLRLPDRLKARVEQAATEDGVSVNSWLVRAIAAALEPKSRRAAKREARDGDSFTGWAR
jgi:hypothetical protein